MRGGEGESVKPYYEEDGITIYHGDCREVLPLLTVEAIVADPPYGIAYSPGGGGKGWAPNSKTFTGDDLIIGDDETFNPTFLLRYDVVVLWGANHYADRLPPMPSWVIWDKRLTNDFSNDFADCEMAWTNQGGPARMFRHLWNGLLKDSERGERRVHPAQKPLALMKWVIGKYTIENHIVCDPFMGSGTTLRAAKDLGRRAIGIEIEEKYCEIAAKRLAQKVFEF
jgi:DNA modification methylase